jgi:hypothetical protein
MTDDQFDELSKKALAFDAGSPNEATWSRIRPVRWKWLPTVPEILFCGCVCGLALLLVGLRAPGLPPEEPSPIVQRALSNSPSSIVASVSRIDGAPPARG